MCDRKVPDTPNELIKQLWLKKKDRIQLLPFFFPFNNRAMVKDRKEREKEKEKEKEKGFGKAGGERRVLVGLFWNCAAELKIILTALLLLCSLVTLFQFLPTRFFPFYYRPLPCCVTPAVNVHLEDTTTNITNITTTTTTTLPSRPLEEIISYGVIKRSLHPVGTAAYNFILMSAYRGGPNTFAIIGISSKPLHVFGHPTYTCEYHSNNDATPVASVRGYKILPDWGYGRVYTTVVINCTFPENTAAVEDSTSGGMLLLLASVNGGYDTEIKTTDVIPALTEPPESWNVSRFTISSPEYDYLYCGSPLYGNLSPQRLREWIAYHVRLFGERSHFVIYDAGGIQPEVLEVLKPWMELGYVTLQDIREQERFDAYYHNQFLVVNDCLHRYRFATKWMFFFDADEFIYLTGKASFESVMDSVEEYSQLTIEQVPMSNQLCLIQDAANITKKWGFEKLVYRNVKKVVRRDKKYAVQPRNVFAAGVHLSKNFQGKSTYKTSHLMKYFHYHGTIAQRREPCRRLVNETLAMVDNIPYVQDTNMKSIGPLVRRFELERIGSRLESTRQ